MNNASPAPVRKLTPATGFAGVFLAVFLLVLLIGAIITFVMPEVYQGVARVRVDRPEQLDVFSSPANLEAVVRQLDLDRTYALRYGEDQPLSLERTTELLRRSLQVRPVRDTNSTVAEIRVHSLSPNEAAQLANAVAQTGISNIVSAIPKGNQDTLARIDRAEPRVIDKAMPVLKPVRPNKPLNLGLAAVVGSLLGVMAGGVGARLALGTGRESRPGS